MSIGRFVIWISLVAGCIEPQLKPCGDLLCAANSVCLPSGQCATQESLDVCVGIPEGGTCTTTIFTGSCVMGVCTAPRCGDGVVSGSEQCDGSVSGVDCVTYGFDTGVPTCSTLCGLDVVNSCVRFGWERIYAEATAFAWTNGTMFALVTADHRHVQLFDGTTQIQDATFPDSNFIYSLAGNGTTVAVALYALVVRSENGGPFMELDASSLAGGEDMVQVGDDGTVYAGTFNSGATISRWTGSTWQRILETTTPAAMMQWVDGHLYVAYEDGGLDRYTPGGAWTSVTTAPSRIRYVAVRPAGGLYISTINDAVFELVGTTLVPLLDSSYAQLVPLNGELYAGGDDNRLVRHDGTSYEQIDCPIYGSLTTDGTNLYIYGNGLYRYSGTQFAVRNGVTEAAQDVKFLSSGEVAFVTSSQVQVSSNYDAWNFYSPTELPVAVAGHSGTDMFVAEMGPLLEHWNGTAFSAVTLPAATPTINDIVWDDATSTLYAVGEQGLAMKRVGTTWTMLPANSGCDLFELAMHGTDLHAVGTCGTEGVIWKLSGTSWVEEHRSSISLVSVWIDADDNEYASGPEGGVTRIAGAWHDEPSAKGISISATSPQDIWVGGGTGDLVHDDGMQWSRVRIVGAATPHVLATPRAVYIAGASTSVLIR